MSKQSTELAWDITDWDKDADLSESNIIYNLQNTFLKDGLILPASIICRAEQELKLRSNFYIRGMNLDEDGTGIHSIHTDFGVFKLKVLPLIRRERTFQPNYTKAVRGEQELVYEKKELGCCNWKAPIVNHHITNANIKEWARDYDGPQFDGILCDPPYELGFMGKSWDSSGIAFDKDMWADILKLLKPGGHLLAFSGSRTYHRMAVAIEDAGFEIRDMIEWVYGSGFPKSLNIGKAVDKLQGNERQEYIAPIAKPDSDCWGIPNNKSDGSYQESSYNTNVQNVNVGAGMRRHTKGTSEWEGWGTALKPAHEPCVLARKPIEGTVANNVLKHGTGGLNIDGTRVGVGAKKWSEPKGGIWSDSVDNGATLQDNPLGRFPANLIHDGSDEVEAVFPQTNPSKAGGKSGVDPGMWAGKKLTDRGGHNDNGGSASRFFYTAKSSKSERNAGLEGFEDVLGGSLEGGNDKRKGDRPQLQLTKNHHPTVKPLSLTKYLATLIKPPTGGRLLVPFSGSGSEMIGALQAGWEYVEGVELTEEYIPIAEARIKYWLDQMAQEDAKPKQESLL